MVKEAAVPSTVQASSTNDAKARLPTNGNLAVKCPKCREILYGRDWEKNLKVCSRCGYHFKLTAYERIELLVDPGSFVEADADIVSVAWGRWLVKRLPVLSSWALSGTRLS